MEGQRALSSPAVGSKHFHNAGRSQLDCGFSECPFLFVHSAEPFGLTNRILTRELMKMSTSSQHEPMYASEHARAARRKHRRGLLLVGLFKLAKAIFFGFLGIGALQLQHRNLGDLVMRLTAIVPLDPEGRFVSLLMDKADLVGAHQLRLVSVSSISYAVVCIVEGTGLVMEKVWAEYFTLTLTALALPWELYKLVQEPTVYSAALIFANLLILAYLVWLVRRRKQRLSS